VRAAEQPISGRVFTPSVSLIIIIILFIGSSQKQVGSKVIRRSCTANCYVT